jgi:hypothetical protein
MTRQNLFVLMCGVGVATFNIAAPVEAQPTASTTPIEVAAVADVNPGIIFPPATMMPGVAVTLPRGPTTAVELFFSVGRGVGGFFSKEPGAIGMFGDFGVQLKRFHGNGADDLRVFHAFGLLGGFGLSTTTCCVRLDRGTVISDTRTTSMNVLPPILPFVGIGLDRRLRHARLRLEVESGVFVVRGIIAVAVPLARRPRALPRRLTSNGADAPSCLCHHGAACSALDPAARASPEGFSRGRSTAELGLGLSQLRGSRLDEGAANTSLRATSGFAPRRHAHRRRWIDTAGADCRPTVVASAARAGRVAATSEPRDRRQE